ncbi:MAG: hypothetical protein ABEK50_01000 [bacterium]
MEVFVLNEAPTPPNFKVVKSFSTSGIVNGSVLLPGDAINTGHKVRVKAGSLYGKLGTSNIMRVQFEGGSRFVHRGRPRSPNSLLIDVLEGRGAMRVNGEPQGLRFGDEFFILRRGTLRWVYESDRLQLTIGASTRLSVRRQGVPVSIEQTSATVETRKDVVFKWPSDGNPNPVDDYQQHSTLTRGQVVLNRLLSASRNGKVPRSPLDYFGHWVRDRWGSVYLYKPHEEGASLRSPGPDKRLFTEDDRVWKGRIN